MGWIKDVQFMQKSFDMTYQESDCMTIPNNKLSKIDYMGYGGHDMLEIKQ